MHRKYEVGLSQAGSIVVRTIDTQTGEYVFVNDKLGGINRFIIAPRSMYVVRYDLQKNVYSLKNKDVEIILHNPDELLKQMKDWKSAIKKHPQIDRVASAKVASTPVRKSNNGNRVVAAVLAGTTFITVGALIAKSLFDRSDDPQIINTPTEPTKDPYYLQITDDPTGLGLSTPEKQEPFDLGEIIYHKYSDRTNTDKAALARENCQELIYKIAPRFGLDPNLVLAIATQERAVHSSSIDPAGGIGLMQIQYGVWINQSINYYELNEQDGKYYLKTMKITDEKLRSIETNIEVGCAILQNYLKEKKYNIPVAIQAYNQGTGTMSSIVKEYARDTGKTPEQVIADHKDLGWTVYRENYKGDKEYLEHVLSYLINNQKQENDVATIKIVDPVTGDVHTVSFTNNVQRVVSIEPQVQETERPVRSR